ncbi:MAG: sel1 repeat family protein [Victivallaceae bacterium]|nr:sel1 repeat family protein [Victivallaceae bacterium]
MFWTILKIIGYIVGGLFALGILGGILGCIFDAITIRRYKKAAERGDAGAQYFLGRHYYDQPDYVEAVRWYRKAAKQGHVDAQFGLACCYNNGEGVKKDGAEAARWFRKAAEQGHTSAQYVLALCYENGNGVPWDEIEAARWLRKAAEQGDGRARSDLAKKPKFKPDLSITITPAEIQIVETDTVRMSEDDEKIK